jgi:hypothetical protein
MSETGPTPLDMAVVVLSCDSYADLWPPFFETFFASWKDYSFPLYLRANKKTFDDRRVTTLLSGEDPDWSTSIRASLMQIDHEYVFLVSDDVFFDRPVDWAKMDRLLSFVDAKRPSYLRFRPIPKPDERCDRYFGRFQENTLYRTSVFGIWKRQVLVDLLAPGESAWQFEHNSPARAAHLPDFFGVYEDYFSYIHGIEKGIWIPSAVEALRARGIFPDLEKRKQMSQEAYHRHRSAMQREKIFNAAPAFVRPMLIAAKRRMTRLRGH